MPVPRPISVARFERKLRAILGAAGSTLLSGVEDHIQGLIVLEGDRAEWGFAGGEGRFWDSLTTPLLAANFSGNALVNPADSGVLGIVQRVQNQGGQAAQFFESPAPPITGDEGTQTPGVRESRYNALGGALRLHTVRSTARGGNGPHWTLQPQTELFEPDFHILKPGAILYLWNTVVNIAHTSAWMWREVPLESSIAG